MIAGNLLRCALMPWRFVFDSGSSAALRSGLGNTHILQYAAFSSPRSLGDAYDRQNALPLSISPVVSGSPNIRFMFCTACPDAPFTRLSMTELMCT